MLFPAVRPYALLLFMLATVGSAAAQQVPSIGYMFPPGGRAGETVEVILGGYDWTPDMQVFVHDPRVQLELISPPGPVIVPEPPFWFEKKSRRQPFPLPREVRARLTISPDTEPGVYRWQVANANGSSIPGRFVVGDGPELIEVDGRTQPQEIDALPVTILGQIKHIEEVDRYRFSVPRSGPVTCTVMARAVGSPLHAILEARDDTGRLVDDAADTTGRDTAFTFAAEANRQYTVSVYDLDFRGNRSFVYRLAITPGPWVRAALPACGQRGQTQSVEFVGYGVATGSDKLESTVRQVEFPADETIDAILYRLDTPYGVAPPWSLGLGNLAESVEPPGADPEDRRLTAPTAVTGVLDERFGKDEYWFTGNKDDRLTIEVSARRIGSPLDVALSILGPDGKEVLSQDDLPDSTDVVVSMVVPSDGEYVIQVSDVSGVGTERAAVYRLSIIQAKPDFNLSTPELLNVAIGEKGSLPVTVVRSDSFQGEIAIHLNDLPPGLTAPEALVIPADKNELTVELTAAADAPATAALVIVVGEAQVNEQTLRRTAGPTLLATTIKPPFSIDAEGKEDVTKWPRGSTFPIPVLIERAEGFEGQIVLEMSSRQGRHRQGIHGPELTVPPDVVRILYPVFLPEWLETNRTSRMRVNGVAQVADPQGNVRYSMVLQKTRMGFLPVGALLALAAGTEEFAVAAGQTFHVPLMIRRSGKLVEPVRLELRETRQVDAPFAAQPQMLAPDQSRFDFAVTANSIESVAGEHEMVIRATIMQDGQWPVVSEATVVVSVSF